MSISPVESTDDLITCRRVSLHEARRRGVDPSDAEDVAQDVCLRMHIRSSVEGREIHRVAAWTRKTTRNLIIDRHRQKNSQKFGGGAVESLSDYDDDLNRRE